VQEGKREIRYQFRQCSVWGVSLRESVTMYFFKLFEYQGDMSARFDPPTLGLGGESVAQGCKNLPPVAIYGRVYCGAYGPGDLGFMCKKSLL
jgi:hypothetical protein